MVYLFDTDAISEVLRPKPLHRYVRWLQTIPPAEQFTSAVVVRELFKGVVRGQLPAYRRWNEPVYPEKIAASPAPAKGQVLEK